MTTIPSKTVTVLGSNIHYLEAGKGDPILFLHGIPASSYLWRNIIPHVSELGRCIAPDLIGYGKSDKPDITYSIFDHIKYVDAFIDALNLKHLIIVMHGWGSIIGCHYAAQHSANCKGLVFYEPFLDADGKNEKPLALVEQVSTLQKQLMGNKKFETNAIIDTLLETLTMRKLEKSELEHYRQPFSSDQSLKPILQYIKELPTGNGNSKIDNLIADYTKALTRSTMPKLMLYSVPGFITTMATVMWAKEHLPNLEVVDIGEELHFAQESHPELMGETISVWLQSAEKQ